MYVSHSLCTPLGASSLASSYVFNRVDRKRISKSARATLTPRLGPPTYRRRAQLWTCSEEIFHNIATAIPGRASPLRPGASLAPLALRSWIWLATHLAACT